GADTTTGSIASRSRGQPVPVAVQPFVQELNPPGPLARSIGVRILVVEDDADGADALASLLRDLGREVEVALGATAALAIGRQRVPNLAFVSLKVHDWT